MGNAVSPATRAPAGAIDSYIAELATDIVYDKSVGNSRFLKSVKARHRHGPLLVKVFIKPDTALSLRTYHSRLNTERDNLSDIPNVYHYQSFAETEKAGYIIRQWLASSLYDRISTRPFLTTIEKKWIAFQILVGMRDARARNVAHGDIKSENILVTSWNWVYITDFACNIKPTYLPLDDPADFSFFYDSSSRRTCYLAPERFYEAGSEIDKKKSELEFYKRDGTVTEAMDVFSAGCVLAELFMDGAPTFTLSQLYKYRSKEFNLQQHLSSIEEPSIQKLVLQMLALDPEARPTFSAVLESARDVAFPESFYSFFHHYITELHELSSPSPFAKATQTGIGQISTLDGRSPMVDGSPLPADCDHRINQIWTDFNATLPHIAVEREPTERRQAFNLDGNLPLKDVLPVEIFVPQLPSSLSSNGFQAATEDGNALILLSLICANLRYCSLPSSRLRALDVLLALSHYLTDEAKLDRLVPYLVDLTQDEAPSVRCAALRTILQVVTMVSVITPSNADIFPEYLIPNIRHLAVDPDVLVRCMYGQCIVPLADSSMRYLEMGQALKAHGTYRLGGGEALPLDEVTYDARVADLQTMIQEQLISLLVDKSSTVKRAVLHNTSALCIFFGRQKANDVLLSHMITYLNDRDWLLRYAFFQSIVDVSVCVGGRSLDEYILPLTMQSLSDSEETVVARVIHSLTGLSELGLFQRQRVWELMNAIMGFLYHPNIWIREAAASFLASAAAHLPTTDVWCILYPSLKYFLRSDVKTLTEESLLSMLKAPIPRPIFDAVVAWAKKDDRSQVWTMPTVRNRTISRAEAVRESLATIRRSVTSSLKSATTGKTDEDYLQINRLHQMGMTPTEEGKLLTLRDHISKLAAQKGSSLSQRGETFNEQEEMLKQMSAINLQKLGVIPNTIFPGTHLPTGNHRKPPTSRVSSFADTNLRTPSTPSGLRSPLLGTQSTNPLEDLRKRLNAMDGSTTSLNSLASPRDRERERRDSVNSTSGGYYKSPTRDRSPPESVTSGEPGSSYRRRQRLQLSGDSTGKAPPLVGSIRTNATGVLEAPAAALKPLHEGIAVSGRSSPVSQVGTLRGEKRAPAGLIPAPMSNAGDDPGINNILEQMNLETEREGMQDFGPRVPEGAVRRRAGARTSMRNPDSNSRKGDVTLIANLTAHTGPINGIVVSPDHLFFVSCSDDKTVRIWDTSRLERNVTSKPRHTYAQHHARVTCVCTIERSHCFASAGEDGSLHVVRVHLSQSGSMPKYGKVSIIREHRVENPGDYITCLAHYLTDATSTLVYATTQGSIVLLDLRTMKVLQQFENPAHFGSISAMCVDKNRTWLVVGTLSGMLALWDLRFGLLLRTWKAGSAIQPGIPSRIHQCSIHPRKSPWIIVASETRFNEGQETVLVEIWDIEHGKLVESLMTREPQTQQGRAHGQDATVHAPNVNTTAVPTTQSPAEAIAALVQSRRNARNTVNEEPQADSAISQPDVRAIFTGIEFGGQTQSTGLLLEQEQGRRVKKVDQSFILTGSEDRKLRLWHLGQVDRSMLISGGDAEKPLPTFSTIRVPGSDALCHTESWMRTSQDGRNNRNTLRATLIGHQQQTILKTHQDCISAVCCIDSPFRGGIVSGDRSGIIKVFRVVLGDPHSNSLDD